MHRIALIALVVLAAGLTTLAAAPRAEAQGIEAGVGRADLTPPTGMITGGFVRADTKAGGQHTRLFARAVVLRRGATKVALVSTDLLATPSGLVTEVARLLEGRDFDERRLLISASHTHGGPGGYFNFSTYNAAFMSSEQPLAFNFDVDPQLHAFLARRIALAIARADESVGPAMVGWGHTELLGATRNRSLEAHLANFGLDLSYGTGHEHQAPGGYRRTVDPNVDVLRVDRIVGRRVIPAGGWMVFANHGTVNRSSFAVYTADHHGSATNVFERAVRRKGRVHPARDVVAAYGNGTAGDMSAGLARHGPAHADATGRREARAMLGAWRRAGRRMSRDVELDWRWTRVPFPGQRTRSNGTVASEPAIGLPQFTGSEEGRGPLHDETGDHYEGTRLPASAGPQGRKVQLVRPPIAELPDVFPALAIRVGDRAIISVPGEMTAELGRRLRQAAAAQARGSGIRHIVISGYANEFISYLTTPEEYEAQHYEGGATFWGVHSGTHVIESAADVVGALGRGEPAPPPAAFDPVNGLVPDHTPYGQGAERGEVLAQPRPVRRLQRARFAWQGGERGLDRPLGSAFVRVERRVRGRWRQVDSDLGTRMLWKVDEEGRYQAWWEVPHTTPRVPHRFVITANRYRLASAPFRIGPAVDLGVELLGARGGRAGLTITYPRPEPEVDIAFRPFRASGGRLAARVGTRSESARARRGRSALIVRATPGERIRIPAGGARDRFGNRTGERIVLTP